MRRTKYVLDTNIYIKANRDRQWAQQLVAFYETNLPFTFLHSVVVQELLLGAIDAAKLKQLQTSYFAPFESRGRVITPSYTSWKRSGEMIARLIEGKHVSPKNLSRSFLNDALLAASCRDRGVTLLTTNERDFKRLREVEQFSFVTPWPKG